MNDSTPTATTVASLLVVTTTPSAYSPTFADVRALAAKALCSPEDAESALERCNGDASSAFVELVIARSVAAKKTAISDYRTRFLMKHDTLHCAAWLNRPLAEHSFIVKPDTPKAGVTFYDMEPLLANVPIQRTIAKLLFENIKQDAVARIIDTSDDDGPFVILACASRGYFLATWLAWEIGDAPIIPVRKTSDALRLVKSAADFVAVSGSYDTEYSTASNSMCITTKLPLNARVLIVDDVLATGGTIAATAELVAKSEPTAKVVGSVVLLDVGIYDHDQHLRDGAAKVFTAFRVTKLADGNGGSSVKLVDAYWD